MYARFFKRLLDFLLSLIAIIVLSPVLLILTVAGAIAMGGNPFFVQPRLGKKDKSGNEKVFNLIKFRSMDNRRDSNGVLLPDNVRLNKYGRILRSTSIDEIPELINILFGNMSFIGPRPLLVRYLPYYTLEERHRHDVRPGLTGLAQVNGRSFLSWEEIFNFDIEYVSSISFFNDLKIVMKTIAKVIRRKNIADATKMTKDADGKLHVVLDGKDVIIHQALDVQRMETLQLTNRL